MVTGKLPFKERQPHRMLYLMRRGPTFRPGLSPGEHLHHVSLPSPSRAWRGGSKRDLGPEKGHTRRGMGNADLASSLAQAGRWTVVTGETGVGGPVKLEPCTSPRSGCLTSLCLSAHVRNTDTL